MEIRRSNRLLSASFNAGEAFLRDYPAPGQRRALLIEGGSDEVDLRPHQKQEDHRGVLVPSPRLCTGEGDPVVEALNTVLRMACGQPERTCALFVSSVQGAIRAHLAYTYGSADSAASLPSQRLSHWQERRAKDFLATNAGNDVSIGGAAAVCKLSRSYFIRAFKNTTGETPHRWLNLYRVEQAKHLLRGETAIVQIAADCGFADQSHLTRVFAKITGLPPGTWRREYRDVSVSHTETDLRRSGTAA